ncbi:MAG: DUF47 domain-containing protein [Candidatus Limnocylindrales bacterium]
MVRLIPRDRGFYELFGRLADKLELAAHRLEALVSAFDRLTESVAEIQVLEHEVDIIDREVLTRLDHAFITPFDREDIHELSSRLDDVVDRVQETAEAFVIYAIHATRPVAVELAGIAAAQSSHLASAVRQIEHPKGIGPDLEAIHRLEHQADGMSRAAIAALFVDGADALEALRWREVYVLLEETVDAIEDAGEVVERIVAKNF